MTEVKKYALLDTDFISKSYSVQDDKGNHLIDHVIELPVDLVSILCSIGWDL